MYWFTVVDQFYSCRSHAQVFDGVRYVHTWYIWQGEHVYRFTLVVCAVMVAMLSTVSTSVCAFRVGYLGCTYVLQLIYSGRG